MLWVDVYAKNVLTSDVTCRSGAPSTWWRLLKSNHFKLKSSVLLVLLTHLSCKKMKLCLFECLAYLYNCRYGQFSRFLRNVVEIVFFKSLKIGISCIAFMCFFAFMFSLFSLLLYVFIDVRLSHLNKDYLLTYLLHYVDSSILHSLRHVYVYVCNSV